MVDWFLMQQNYRNNFSQFPVAVTETISIVLHPQFSLPISWLLKQTVRNCLLGNNTGNCHVFNEVCC